MTLHNFVLCGCVFFLLEDYTQDDWPRFGICNEFWYCSFYHPVVHSARKCERDEVQDEGEGAVVVHRQGEAAPLRQGRGCVGVCLCDTVHWGGRRKAGVTHPLIPSLINLYTFAFSPCSSF